MANKRETEVIQFVEDTILSVENCSKTEEQNAAEEREEEMERIRLKCSY